MIISPPILKIAQENMSDDEWLARLMPFSALGGFPISSRLAWHGGQHIEHTDTGAKAEPVRAIADGEVVYSRNPSPDAAKKPLAYQGETDNGCVVIKHNTEIGQGAEGEIEYYSIYMHLKQVFVKKKQPVNRKDSLGTIGSCNGKNAMHLEIICDDANLKKIVGRDSGPLDVSKDGRKNIVYGDIHFYLPPGTPFFSAIKSLQTRTGSGAPLYISDVALFVTMRFKNGECLLTTKQEEKNNEGSFIELNKNVSSSDKKYEYNINKKAIDLSNSFSITPSAAYELLRFGRVIDTANETEITSGSVPHWHEVGFSNGKGWVNLNAENVTKFSDADFPHWSAWSLISDDLTPNSQCNSPTLEKWLAGNSGKKIDGSTMERKLSDFKNIIRLSRSICKFPTEWEKGKIDDRYDWLQKPSDILKEPLSSDQYSEFKKHVGSLAFWEDAAIEGITSEHWHFCPSTFISHFRKNLWLDKHELAKVYPDKLMQKVVNQTPDEIREQYRIHLNKVTRKYLYITPVKLAHFYGQGAVESGMLAQMVEKSQKQDYVNKIGLGIEPKSAISEKTLGHWYGARPDELDLYYAKDKYNSKGIKITGSYSWSNGNCGDVDAQKFRGRGFKQLTGRSNYASYWVYRGYIKKSQYDDSWWDDASYKKKDAKSMKKLPAQIDDPQKISTNDYDCIDAGGFYLAFERPKSLEFMNMRGESAVTNITKAINGGDIGLNERKAQTARIEKILID
jgi:predicted chitinase